MLQTPDVKTKALLDLADFMEKLDPKLYRQDVFYDGCGRGCIAYWACMVGNIESHYTKAAELLGLDQEQTNRLFNPDAGQVTVLGCVLRGPKTKEAARAIRHLAVTGHVPPRW